AVSCSLGPGSPAQASIGPKPPTTPVTAPVSTLGSSEALPGFVPYACAAKRIIWPIHAGLRNGPVAQTARTLTVFLNQHRQPMRATSLIVRFLRNEWLER